MKKSLLFVTVIGLSICASSCYKNPVTGRSSLNVVPTGTLTSLSNTQYRDFLNSNKAITGTADAKMVSLVGQRLATAISQYYSSKGMNDILKDYKWEFNLVQGAEKNAWCMPGGKVVIYTGILPITQTETGLAVVMGHEIAHAIARHGNERLTQNLLKEGGGMALDVALANKPSQTRALFNTAYGVGSTVGVLLPFSRKHESEADEMGLIFMAMAGYNPQEAVSFWQRMQAASGKSSSNDWLSTHPSNASRIKDIQTQLPKVLPIYNQYKK